MGYNSIDARIRGVYWRVMEGFHGRPQSELEAKKITDLMLGDAQTVTDVLEAMVSLLKTGPQAWDLSKLDIFGLSVKLLKETYAEGQIVFSLAVKKALPEGVKL